MPQRPKYSEQDLAEGCMKHNALIQRTVFEKYYGLMLSICLRYAGNREEARDMLQEGFVKIFERIVQYDMAYSFEGWMKKVMVNTAIDHYRKQARMPLHDDESILANETDHYQDILSQLSHEEIIGCIQRLPDGYRTVFNMYVIEGYSHKEIGEQLGIAEGTSKSQLNKAKGLLQKRITALKEYYNHNENV